MIKKLTHDETAYFCEQLALMLNAGMQLSSGIEVLCEDIDDKRIISICSSLLDDLNNDETLAQAMESSTVFPDYVIKMVRIGEVTGELENVLVGLAHYYEERAELNRMVRSAVLHPMMLLVMMTAVIVVLIVLVLPMFGDIFSQFDSSISESVQLTVDVAYGVGTAMLIVLVVIIAAAAVIAILSNFSGFRHKLSSFLAVFPLTSKISRSFSLSKIAGAMSMMVSAGIAPDEMVEYAAELIDDKNLREKLEKCRERLLAGEYFADVIASSGIFPAVHARSLKIAYSSGSFEKAWRKLSDRCDEKATESAASIVSFIEPSIVIILATVIGAILLTVMIPLMNIMSVMG